jgi:hypothetical protein
MHTPADELENNFIYANYPNERASLKKLSLLLYLAFLSTWRFKK